MKSTWHMASATRIEALGTLPWEIRGAAPPPGCFMQGHRPSGVTGVGWGY